MKMPPAAYHSSGPGTFAIVYVPALLLLAGTMLVCVGGGVPPAFFCRDPMAPLEGHPLTGAQSTVGVFVWCGAAAICLFSGATLRKAGDNKTLWHFFACSGALTLLLALDDFFLVHDDLAERYLRIGEKPVLLVYAALVGAYVISFRRTILRSDCPLLILAFLFFGLSLAVDVMQGRWLSPWRIFAEDGCKLLGIVSWSGYLVRRCFQAMAASAPAGPRFAKEQSA
jgi:hypothetical protein